MLATFVQALFWITTDSREKGASQIPLFHSVGMVLMACLAMSGMTRQAWFLFPLLLIFPVAHLAIETLFVTGIISEVDEEEGLAALPLGRVASLNKAINEACRRFVNEMVKQLALPESVAVARDIVTTGNTSAASVPLAMHELLRTGAVKSGGYALEIGFGAGLAFAAQVVVLP